ncbi:MAG: PKD domain-containing protein, partial [Bacteroidales bacterium]
VFFTSNLNSTLPSAYLWSFGDGFTSSLQNSYHVYSYPGVYTVVLTVTNACGSSYAVKEKYIIVSDQGAPPIPEFIASQTTIIAGNAINFTDLSLNNPQTWQWSFAGGTPNSSNVQHPSQIVYYIPGIYNVSLTVSNAFGDSTLTKNSYITVVAAGGAPVADFIANVTNITVGQSVNFTDLSLNNPTTWQWQFAGGTPSTSSLQHPQNIVYNTPGTYDVTLTVSNIMGSDTLTKLSYINVIPVNITQVFIKKITLEDMPFPQMLPRNPYYKITTPDNTLLKDGRSEALYGITQYNMPVFWDLNPYFQIPTIGNWYKIQIWDAQLLPINDIFVREVVFNMGNYTSPPNAYPPTITLTQNQLKITLDLQWQ